MTVKEIEPPPPQWKMVKLHPPKWMDFTEGVLESLAIGLKLFPMILGMCLFVCFATTIGLISMTVICATVVWIFLCVSCPRMTPVKTCIHFVLIMTLTIYGASLILEGVSDINKLTSEPQNCLNCGKGQPGPSLLDKEKSLPGLRWESGSAFLKRISDEEAAHNLNAVVNYELLRGCSVPVPCDFDSKGSAKCWKIIPCVYVDIRDDDKDNDEFVN